MFVALFSAKGKDMGTAKRLKLLGRKCIKIREVFFTFGHYDGMILFVILMKRGFEFRYGNGASQHSTLWELLLQF